MIEIDGHEILTTLEEKLDPRHAAVATADAIVGAWERSPLAAALAHATYG